MKFCGWYDRLSLLSWSSVRPTYTEAWIIRFSANDSLVSAELDLDLDLVSRDLFKVTAYIGRISSMCLYWLYAVYGDQSFSCSQRQALLCRV